MRSRTSLAQCLLAALVLTTGAAASRAADAPAATVTDDGKQIVLDNGLISLTLAKDGGQGTSIKYRQDGREVELAAGRSVLYFDVGGGRVYPVRGAEGQVVRKGPDAVEAAWAGKPTDRVPFETEFHCVLRRGESGFYLYAVYKHGPEMAAGGIGETRFVIKGVPGTRVFTHHVVDDKRKGPYPTARQVETIQDTTWRLEDGTIYTKYDNSAYLADHHVHGMAGHGVGMWMIFPSNEFIGGGPFKQELTVHKENVLLAMLVGGHFGSGGLRFRQGDPWEKVYGPVFVYVNAADSVDRMWDDAKKRAAAEVAKWPYAWLERKEYPLKRGTVSGTLRLTDGTSAKDAWVLLSPPGEDWTQALKGYDFWTRADDKGRFTLTKVRPGRYTLTAIGANQFEEFRRENVEVKEGANDLGELTWKPVTHGRALWQIGVADRSSHEFKGGDNYRHYDNFLRYPREFPDDVTFVIGKSKEADDWNFAQWAVYSKRPSWAIKFDLPAEAKGKATLTIGFTSAHPPRGSRTNLQVKVNGEQVEVIRLPKTGTSGYRSGSGDSPCNVVRVTFDAGRLKKGANEITLGHAEAVPAAEHKRGVPGQVMYDAIRLEVDPEATDEYDHTLRTALEMVERLGEEKTDEAKWHKKAIADLQGLLDKAEQMEVFQLNPRQVEEAKQAPEKTFHGYEILRRARAERAEQREEVAALLGKSLHWSELLRAACFNPRHGLRLVHDKRTVDLVICFECHYIKIYEGDEPAGSLSVLAREHKVFEQILDAPRR